MAVWIVVIQHEFVVSDLELGGSDDPVGCFIGHVGGRDFGGRGGVIQFEFEVVDGVASVSIGYGVGVMPRSVIDTTIPFKGVAMSAFDLGFIFDEVTDFKVEVNEPFTTVLVGAYARIGIGSWTIVMQVESVFSVSAWAFETDKV